MTSSSKHKSYNLFSLIYELFYKFYWQNSALLIPVTTTVIDLSSSTYSIYSFYKFDKTHNPSVFNLSWQKYDCHNI